MNGIMQLTFVLEAFSAVVLLMLLYIYLTNMKVMKSRFTIGLVVFAALLFLENVVTLYDHFLLSRVYEAGEPTFVFVASVLEAAGLAALLYITCKGC